MSVSSQIWEDRCGTNNRKATVVFCSNSSKTKALEDETLAESIIKPITQPLGSIKAAGQSVGPTVNLSHPVN